jgi:hypothetical protein
MASTATSPQAPTAYESLHAYLSLEARDHSASHPFGSQASVGDDLKRLIAATDQVSATLNQYLAQPDNDAKLVSALRQRAGIQSIYNQGRHAVQQMAQTLRAHVSSRTFGEDVPAALEAIPDWCIAQLEKWGKNAGMEAFPQEESDGHVSVLLGGKVLVLDVDFLISRDDILSPKITVVSVKTSYASADGATTTAASSASLAGFVHDCLSEFVLAAQVDEDIRDVIRIAELVRKLREHLVYLVRLDQLAKAEGDPGVRWFTGLDELASRLEANAVADARSVAKYVVRLQT